MSCLNGCIGSGKLERIGPKVYYYNYCYCSSSSNTAMTFILMVPSEGMGLWGRKLSSHLSQRLTILKQTQIKGENEAGGENQGRICDYIQYTCLSTVTVFLHY